MHRQSLKQSNFLTLFADKFPLDGDGTITGRIESVKEGISTSKINFKMRFGA